MTLMIKLIDLRAAALAGCAMAGAILTGCGGATTSSNNLVPQTPAGPAIYGLEPSGSVVGAEYFETSGFGTADLKTGYVTGAVASTAKPPKSITINGTIPLGFAPGSQYIDGSFANAVTAGAPVIFRAYISNGNDAAGNLIAINPSSVKLASPELPGFSEALTFTSAFVGPLANGQYTTPTFALPFSTPGLHQVTAAVADSAGETSTTTFDVAVVNAGAACVVAQIVDANGAAIPGATASITGDLGVTEQKTADAQGVVILFATPIAGGNTITVTAGGKTATSTQTLTGGGTLSSVTTTSGSTTSTTPYQITVT